LSFPAADFVRLAVSRNEADIRDASLANRRFAKKRLVSIRLRANLLLISIKLFVIFANILFAPNAHINQLYASIPEETLELSRWELKLLSRAMFALPAQTIYSSYKTLSSHLLMNRLKELLNHFPAEALFSAQVLFQAVLPTDQMKKYSR